MVLEKLFKELNVTDDFDKKVIAAVVLDTLNVNHCGVTADNINTVSEKLCEGICTVHELQVLLLAAHWAADLEDILQKKLHFNGGLYKAHIWPFLHENEIVPGVRMQYM